MTDLPLSTEGHKTLETAPYYCVGSNHTGSPNCRSSLGCWHRQAPGQSQRLDGLRRTRQQVRTYKVVKPMSLDQIYGRGEYAVEYSPLPEKQPCTQAT